MHTGSELLETWIPDGGFMIERRKLNPASPMGWRSKRYFCRLCQPRVSWEACAAISIQFT